jgi:hypothetical protein
VNSDGDIECSVTSSSFANNVRWSHIEISDYWNASWAWVHPGNVNSSYRVSAFADTGDSHQQPLDARQSWVKVSMQEKRREGDQTAHWSRLFVIAHQLRCELAITILKDSQVTQRWCPENTLKSTKNGL